MEKIYIDGKPLNKSDIIPIRSIMYGEGVFETFILKNNKIQFWKEHYKRLLKGAKKIKIPIIPEQKILSSIKKVVKNNQEVIVKIVLLSGIQKENKSYFSDIAKMSHLMIVIRDKHKEKDSFTLTISPYQKNSKSVLNFIKTTNFLENIFTKRYALEHNFDDGILLNENKHITETSCANIFWIKKNIFYTPSLKCGVLPGIIRDNLIKYLKKERVVVYEGSFFINNIEKADFVFITNSIIAIKPVSRIDKSLYPTKIPKILEKFLKLL